jgi:tetratricopeptide (TPR) repeat protein
MSRAKLFSAVLMLLFGCGFAATARAEPLPPLDQMMTPQERQIFTTEIRGQLADVTASKDHGLSLLDNLLAKDAEPTQFRGFLQMMRAPLLLDEGKTREAMAAADESVRLLPGYSGPLLAAMDVYAYSDRPGQAADMLLRASEMDPQSVQLIDDYDIGNLLHRLDAAHDEKRREAVGDKLLSIGWTGKRLESRSDLAFEAIRQRIANQDNVGARALIPELVNPTDSYTLLTDNRYQAIWPDLEKWAGPRLQRQWSVYLTEAEARFAASKAIENVHSYVAALQSAADDKRMISDVLPLLFQKLDPEQDQEFVFFVAPVADALQRAGRWRDVNDLFNRAETIWPLGSSTNALNVTGNHARSLLWEGRPADALALMDRWLEDAKRWGGGVNFDAINTMQLERTCALHQLGRDSDTGTSIAAAVSGGDPDTLVTLDLCLGDIPAARNAVIQALRTEGARGSAIMLMQKPISTRCKSKYCDELDRRFSQLRSDPTLLTELQKYGRVMPFALNEAATALSQPKRNDVQAGVPVTASDEPAVEMRGL